MRHVVVRVDNAVTPSAAFVVEEEESLVFLDRSARRRSENVVAQRRLVVGEKGPGVEFFVAEEFVSRAVEVVGSRAGGHDDESAAGSAVLGRVVTLLRLELLQRFRGRVEPKLGNAEGHVLDDGSVKRPHLVARATPAHREEGQRFAAAFLAIGDVPHQPNQRGAAAASQRHIKDGVAFDELTDGGARGFEQRHRAGDLDGFCHVADLHLDVKGPHETRFERQAGVAGGLEAFDFTDQLILASRHDRKVVGAGLVRLTFESHAGVDVGDGDFGAGNDGACVIGDRSGQPSGCLCAQRQREQTNC